MSDIVRNAIQTPDGTILESHSRWDYKSHVDTKTGKDYMVDGGHDYIRRSTHADQVDLSVWSTDPHKKQADAATWGTYGPNGDQPLKRVPISEMSTLHIENVLKNVQSIYPVYRTIFEMELRKRKDELEAYNHYETKSVDSSNKR